MSDYNNPNNFDKYGNPIPPTGRYQYEPGEGTGRGPYVLLGLLVLIGIVGGAMYFNGGHRTKGANDVASAPAPTTDTRPAPALPRTTPMPNPTTTTPAPMDTPAPSDQPAKQ